MVLEEYEQIHHYTKRHSFSCYSVFACRSSTISHGVLVFVFFRCYKIHVFISICRRVVLSDTRNLKWKQGWGERNEVGRRLFLTFTFPKFLLPFDYLLAIFEIEPPFQSKESGMSSFRLIRQVDAMAGFLPLIPYIQLLIRPTVANTEHVPFVRCGTPIKHILALFFQLCQMPYGS